MMTIYKYKLEITDYQEIKIDGFQKVLSVIKKDNALWLYCIVNPEEKEVDGCVNVIIAGTGNPLQIENKNEPNKRKMCFEYCDSSDEIDENGYEFMGSFIIESIVADFVWHVFCKIGNKL